MKSEAKIEEIIVVEGRDDTTAVTRAVDCHTIETHGFGISKKTWNLLEEAYEKKGLIIFTDPDFSGEEIRKKLSERFPKAKHAYLSKEEAKAGDDIGIENACDKDIIAALQKAKAKVSQEGSVFTLQDLQRAGLSGLPSSKEKREKLGSILGIGYGNTGKLLKKLNAFGITKEEFNEAIFTIDN